MKHILDGKKIIFIGNSFTYYGKTVLEKSNSILEQESRDNDRGFFYQLCKENGADVSITNWTFGAHTLNDTFGGECHAKKECEGVDHFSYLKDRFYDYVTIQAGSADTVESIIENSKKIMAIFKEKNPDAKFLYLVHTNYYIKNRPEILAITKEVEKMGITVVDWGNLVYDIIEANVTVPKAECLYNKNSFIIKKSKPDGYHPNMLTGYITTLMTYCAITGEKAVGKPYSFCNDSSVNEAFDFKKFCDTYYTYNGAKTNFPEIFASSPDMRGIQELIDKYLDEKPYRNY